MKKKIKEKKIKIIKEDKEEEKLIILTMLFRRNENGLESENERKLI
jgi:hypothetical protein